MAGATLVETTMPNDSADALEECLDGVDGSAYYYGTREAFERSGLTPHGLAFPGDMPGMKGARWYGLDRRRYTMSKWNRPPGTFRLNVRLSKDEELEFRRGRENAAKVSKIDRQLAELDIPERNYRHQMARHTLLGWTACKDDLESGHAWRYEPEVIEYVRERVEEIRAMLYHGPVKATRGPVDELLQRKAALSDQKFRVFLACIDSAL